MQDIKISIHNRNLEKRKQSIKNWPIYDEDKKDLLKFLDDLSLGKINKGNRISENRQVKYLEILKIPLEYFNKPLSKLTLKDSEQFQKDLNTDKIKSKKKLPFLPSTKADINRLLKIYLKWKFGDNDNYRKLTDWYDLRIPKKDPKFLCEPEIEKLYKYCKNSSERFLICILFDAGCRAEELHNIRFQDIILPNKDENFVSLALREEYSKTKGRTIKLYWKYSLEAIKEYYYERVKDGIKFNDPFFKNNYENSRQVLNRLGKKVLNKSIHYHLFRHSSATYYATKLNRQELCYRYGWKFSSNMPDIYISRAGMENKQLDEKFTSTELENLKEQLEKEKQKNSIEIENLKKMIMDKVLFQDKVVALMEDSLHQMIKKNNLKLNDNYQEDDDLKLLKNLLRKKSQ